MRGITDHSLVEVANLDFYPTLRVGNWTEISRVAIVTNPDRRALSQ